MQLVCNYILWSLKEKESIEVDTEYRWYQKNSKIGK